MKKKTFIQRIRFKYRVSILNENTLEEAWHARISRMSVFMWTGVLMFFTFVVLALIILFTPLKQYLPGYGNNTEVRAQLLKESFRLDSIATHVELQNKYIKLMQSVIAGDIQPDSASLDTIVLYTHDDILVDKTQLEQEFVANYEEEARYYLPLITSQRDAKTFSFFKPANGIVVSKFSPIDEIYGVRIKTAGKGNVMSVLAGTVIFVDHTIEKGGVITIQHQDNYISTYKYTTRVLTHVGETVKAGEAIAIIETKEEESIDNMFYFEIWREGVPINPQDIITL